MINEKIQKIIILVGMVMAMLVLGYGGILFALALKSPFSQLP